MTTHAMTAPPTASRPVLRLARVDAAYGDVQVIWGLDLVVNDGEAVALVGSNGAGKTTTLKVASGALTPKRGSVFVEEREMTGKRPSDFVSVGVSHVPEGRKLFAGMTVQENLLMGAYLRRDGRPAVAADLEWVYDLFPRLKERRYQLAGTLSGGEQQMCALGRGLMARPRILLIDELSLGLAPVVVDRLVEAIGRVRRDRKISILLVEQDLNVALSLADRAYVLETGHLVKSGRAEDLLMDPEMRAAYLGV